MPDELKEPTMSITSIHLQCLCGTVREPGSSLISFEFPIETEMCHCNICRRISGALAGTYFELKGRPSDTSLAACSRYRNQNGRVYWYFCSQCGTQMFTHTVDIDKWSACSGTLETAPSGMVSNTARIIAHTFAEDTGDGGLALVMPRLRGEDIPVFAQSRKSGLPQMKAEELAQLASNKIESRPLEVTDRLHAACHCEAVSFDITPPRYDAMQNASVAQWLRADGKKYLGLNCMCRYCRLAIGFSMSSNAYVMPENIVLQGVDGSEKPLFDYTCHDSRTSNFTTSTEALRVAFPSLKFDLTSAGHRRCFCGVCGASIFFERASRPQCVNISIGILRADSGSLAADWIQFDWNLVWEKQSAVNGDLVEALEAVP